MVIALVLLFGVGGLFIMSRDEKSEVVAGVQTTKLSMQTIEAEMTNGAQLIDVRTPEEYAAGHIDGAINLPLQDIEAGTFPAGDMSKPAYLYCRSGNRSSQATALLKTAGYTNVTDLGAMTEVQSLGGKVTQ